MDAHVIKVGEEDSEIDGLSSALEASEVSAAEEPSKEGQVEEPPDADDLASDVSAESDSRARNDEKDIEVAVAGLETTNEPGIIEAAIGIDQGKRPDGSPDREKVESEEAGRVQATATADPLPTQSSSKAATQAKLALSNKQLDKASSSKQIEKVLSNKQLDKVSSDKLLQKQVNSSFRNIKVVPLEEAIGKLSSMNRSFRKDINTVTVPPLEDALLRLAALKRCTIPELFPNARLYEVDTESLADSDDEDAAAKRKAAADEAARRAKELKEMEEAARRKKREDEEAAAQAAAEAAALAARNASLEKERQEKLRLEQEQRMAGKWIEGKVYKKRSGVMKKWRLRDMYISQEGLFSISHKKGAKPRLVCKISPELRVERISIAKRPALKIFTPKEYFFRFSDQSDLEIWYAYLKMQVVGRQ